MSTAPLRPNLVPANEVRRQNKLLAAMMRRLIAEGWVRTGENTLGLWTLDGRDLAISDEEQACLRAIIEEGTDAAEA